LAKANTSVDPRKEFNKWLQTKAGQTWKQKQFEYQARKCAACGDSLRFADAAVHHVLSLKEFGSAANQPENFKLLHPGCNLEIGTKIVDFS
jgi:5-methylcytosine-specific restriction endonuclease McrA